MFTQACFIRKNTPELRKKLEELGYFYAYYHKGNGIYCYNNIAQPFTYNNEVPKECIGIPRDNEELFLALAALRDDTHENQWFISNVDIFTECYNNEWKLYEVGEIYYLNAFSCGCENKEGDEHCSPGHPNKNCLNCIAIKWTYEEPIKCACWSLGKVNFNEIKYQLTLEQIKELLK